MVEYITYKGEKYPVRIAWSTLKKIAREQMDEWEQAETALWFGLVSGHVADNKELTLTREDVQFILDESLEEYNEIMRKIYPPSSGNDSEDKKK